LAEVADLRLSRDLTDALEGKFQKDGERRNLQIEARAHVRVQAEIDRMAGAGSLPEPASVEFIQWLHREFYRNAPEAMLRIEGQNRDFIMEPGAWREASTQDVAVGRLALTVCKSQSMSGT
jgi:Fic family protein